MDLRDVKDYALAKPSLFAGDTPLAHLSKEGLGSVKITSLCDECDSGQQSRRLILFLKNSVAMIGIHVVSVQGRILRESLGRIRIRNQELVMENFGYSRCTQCDEEYVFMDGSRCARCLALGFVPIDDEDNEEEPSSVFLDRRAAA